MVTVADAELKLVSAPATDDAIRAAQASAEQAFALAELARRQLNDATITAPVNGVVTEVSAQAGATVAPSAAIMTLIPPELVAEVQVDEAQSAQLEVGQSVQLSVQSFPQESFQGVVKGIAPVLDTRTRTVATQVEVPDPRAKLRPGMYAQLQIQTGQKQAALIVPREAVLRVPAVDVAPAQTLVFTVMENRVRRQRVSVGASDSKSVEILQGLTEGMDVVLNPSTELIDGQLIVPG
jgi:RND family efflux transporter MFP subunit